MDIDRSEFPAHTQLQGMSAQAVHWFLIQREKNDISNYEALRIVHALQEVVLSSIARKQRKKRQPSEPIPLASQSGAEAP